MESARELKKYFRGFPLPKKLIQLADFFDKDSKFFAGSFEVSADKYDGVKSWCKNKTGFENLIGFGIDGIGSIYALWIDPSKYKDLQKTSLEEKKAIIEKAPIVYLGGEGEGTTVIAKNWDDFFKILATNQDYEPFDNNFTDPEDEYAEQSKKFNNWIKKEFELKKTNDPMSLVIKARKEIPEFRKFIENL